MTRFTFLRHRDHRGVRYHGAVPGAVPGLSLQVCSTFPAGISDKVVFFIALLGGAALAGIADFLFGIPVLELGSDYFGIATLGFTVIVKVLLDNTDTLLPFPEMKGLEA